VHVGEVEVVGDNVRGVAVHEAARVMAAADAGEILVSEMARMLVSRTGMNFEDRGIHDFKGVPGATASL
jgi:class 3 adenylate cyclase